MKYLIILVFSLLFSNSLFATHAQSGRITYKCIGVNQYEITLEFYRNCDGSHAPNYINIVSITNLSYSVIEVYRVSVEDVTSLCDTSVSSCNGGTTGGVEKHTYKRNYTFPAGTTNIELILSRCCRPLNLSTIQSNQELYIKTVFDNSLSNCNNAPVFNHDPVFLASRFSVFSTSLSAVDPDGDTLTYELTPPLRANGATLNYLAGYDYLNPLGFGPPFSLSSNGLFCFETTNLETTLTGVIIREFRNGVEIASYYTEYFIETVNAFNAPAYIGSDSSSCNDLDINLTQTGTSVVENDGDSLTLTADDTFCFDLDFNDDSSLTGGTVIMSTTSNAEQVLNGATYTISNNFSANLSAELCWTPTNTDVGTHYVTFSVYDESECPVKTRRDYIYDITVNENTLGLNNYLKENISIYPNPTNQNISISNLKELTNYILYDYNGKKILKGKTNKNIDVSNIANGTYFLKIESPTTTQIKKVIKL